MLRATNLHAAYTREVCCNPNSTFCWLVCKEVEVRLRWATQQLGPQGQRLLYRCDLSGKWEWSAAARGDYRVLLKWFHHGMR